MTDCRLCRNAHENGVFLTAGFDGGTKGFKFNGGPGNVISDGFDRHHVVAIYDGPRKAFDEVGIWSRPLSEQQVLQLYSNGHGVSLAQ